MVYTNRDIATKANTYIRKVSDVAKANHIGRKINNKVIYDEEECTTLLKILNRERDYNMGIVKSKLQEYGPIKRGPLAEKCDMHWITFNRILADLTFYDPHVVEDDHAYLDYLC